MLQLILCLHKKAYHNFVNQVFIHVFRDDYERLRSQFDQATINTFNPFIDQAELIDIHLGGPCFTWSNRGDPSFVNCIDFWLQMDL